MGRIRDAIARQEEHGRRTTAPLLGAAPQSRPNGRPALAEAPPKAQFDFMSYSLGLKAGEGREGVTQLREATPANPVAPVREIELDAGRLDPHLVTLSEYDPGATEQYQRLATSLITSASERPLKRVLITSTLQGEGRTCVLLNLAAALAQARQQVLVLDTDLKRPSVARLLGLDAEAGLTDLLSDAATISDVLGRVSPGGFDVLPTRGQPENAAQLLISPEFEQLLDRLDRNYDFILFDSAPLSEAGDAQLLLRLVDTALVVVAQGRCSAAQATRAVAQIAPEDIFGVVLNRRSE